MSVSHRMFVILLRVSVSEIRCVNFGDVEVKVLRIFNMRRLMTAIFLAGFAGGILSCDGQIIRSEIVFQV